MINSVRILTLAVFLAVSMLSVGAEEGTPQARPEELVSTATQYWKDRMDDKYEKTYALENKEGLPSFDEYVPRAKAMKKLQIRGHSVGNARVEGTEGIVEVRFRVLMPEVPKPLTQVILDKWIFRDGQWWHVFPK